MRSPLAALVSDPVRSRRLAECAGQALHERDVAVIPLDRVADPERRALIRAEAERIWGGVSRESGRR